MVLSCCECLTSTIGRCSPSTVLDVNLSLPRSLFAKVLNLDFEQYEKSSVAPDEYESRDLRTSIGLSDDDPAL